MRTMRTSVKTIQVRFIYGRLPPVGFTEGRVYDAWKAPGEEELRVWNVRNDFGHPRVILLDEPCAHVDYGSDPWSNRHWGSSKEQNGYFTEVKPHDKH